MMKKCLAAVCLLMLLFSCAANAETVKKEFVFRGLTYSVEVDYPEATGMVLTIGAVEYKLDEETNVMEHQLHYSVTSDKGTFSKTFSFGTNCIRIQKRTLNGTKRTEIILGPQQTEHLFNDWQYFNEEKHIHWCQNGFCMSKEKAAHSGGTATCTARAVCEGCGVEYGEIDGDNHLWSEVYKSNGDGTHSLICERDSEHKNTTKVACSGGTATCTACAVCEGCGVEYGEIDGDNHLWSEVYKSNGDGTHSLICERDSEHKNTTKVACSGGTVTCTAPAVCDDCGEEYGTKDKNNHINKEILPAVAPTETKCGWTEGLKCADCGEIIIPRQMIPVLPKTGDGTNLALMAALALIGMAGMTVILRKKNEA